MAVSVTTRVQGGTTTSTLSSLVSPTFTCAAGNLLVAAVTWSKNSTVLPLSAVSDLGGNTWHQAAVYEGSSLPWDTWILYAYNVGAYTNDTVTVALSPSTSYVSITVWVVSGAFGTGDPLRSTAIGTTSTATTLITDTPLTLGGKAGIVIAAVHFRQGPSGWSAGSGYTGVSFQLGSSGDSNKYLADEYQITDFDHHPTMFQSTGTSWGMVAAAFSEVTSNAVVKTIGTSVGATATGTVTATNASTAVTGSGTLFTTEFAGPTTIEIAGVLYNIVSITDDTHLTLYTNYSGTTGSGKTIKKGVRHYSILYAWDDACPASLTAVDQSWRGEMYNDSEFVNSTVAGPMIEIGFITADATRHRELTAAAGQSFQDHASVRTNPLRYDASKGVALRQMDNDYPVINIRNEGYVRLSRLQFKNGANSGQCLVMFQTTAPAVIQDMLMVGNVNGSSSIMATWAGEVISNTVIMQTHATGKTVTGENLGTITFIGCTFIRSTDNSPFGTAIQLNYNGINLISCAVFGFARIAYRSNGTTVVPDGGFSKNSATDLSSGLPGSSNQHSVTYSSSSPFTNAALASLDIRTVTGTTLSANGSLDVRAPRDISTGIRPTAPTIGAWELVPAQAITTSVIASGLTFGAPVVAIVQPVTLATIATTATITAPTVTHVIAEATIPSTSVVYAATLAYALLGASISSTAAVYVPSMTAIVAEAHIASTLVLSAPVISPGAVTIAQSTIASGHALFVPFILPQWYIFFSFLPSTTVVRVPSVVHASIPVTGFTISSTAVLHPVVVVPVYESQGTFIASTATTYPVSLTTTYEILGAFLSSHATVNRPRVEITFEFDIFTADAVTVRFVAVADALDCTPTWPRQAGDLDMTNLQLRRGSDQVVTLPHLRSELDGTFMNAADVTAELVDGEGDVVQIAEMIHILGSDGMYVWSIEGPLFMHRVSTRYELVITALEAGTHFRSVTPVSVID